MAEQEQIRKNAPATSSPEVAEEKPTDSAATNKLKSDMDSLLDEIDDVLETNAEEFVKSYVQKGGQ